MVLRKPFPGQTWQPFWGCMQYPDCRGRRAILDNGLPETDDDLELNEE
jgi:ssDNA-binding Zn-finger/Zn-ribbon topoisomerase 1